MKKIKKFYREHRIFIILMTVVLVCAILIATVLIQCFYVGGKDKYGHRLDGIENYKISESRQNDFENNIANNEKVKSVDMMITGKIIYLTFQFEESTDLETAKELANISLKEFSDEEKDFYDIMITMKKNSSEKIEGFLISGAKNAKRPIIEWNQNRKVDTTTSNSDSTEKDNS